MHENTSRMHAKKKGQILWRLHRKWRFEYPPRRFTTPWINCVPLFFLLAGQLVNVTWSCKFIIDRWKVKICTRFSNWGEALCASETCETSWCMIEKTTSGSWLNSNSEKPGQGPPGTQAPPGTTREKTPNNNMIQRFNSKTIYIQLSRAVTRCSETHEIKISAKMQVWNTSPVLSLKRENGLPRMIPGLPFTDTYLQCSSWKRQLQYTESMAAQNINPGHIAALHSPTGVTIRDDSGLPCLCTNQSCIATTSRSTQSSPKAFTYRFHLSSRV